MATRKKAVTAKKEAEVAVKEVPKVEQVDYKAKYRELVTTIKLELARWKVRQKQFETEGTNMAVNVLTNVLPK